ncbi:MAG: hypothetical protein AB8F94_05895 [Saprospiraceae bacterium]
MSDKNDFYIGWKNEMPPKSKSLIKKILIPLFVFIPILFFVIVLLQKPFNNHLFEFGTASEITGTYYHTPFPILIADDQMVQEGLSKDVLLVGYGKFGAKGTMDAIQKKHGNLQGKKITLSGTLIHGDGKTLLELTDEEASLVKVESQSVVSNLDLGNTSIVKLKGEILDPKCYFGVMKPAEGKVHKSCAIRCISGGIPPVLRHETGDPKNPYQYFLVLDNVGRPINQKILPFVAEQISVEGTATSFASWDILQINIESILK